MLEGVVGAAGEPVDLVLWYWDVMDGCGCAYVGLSGCFLFGKEIGWGWFDKCFRTL